MSEAQRPSVGRIVHVYHRDHEGLSPAGIGPYAAIVTWVYDESKKIDCETFGRSRPNIPWGGPISYTDGGENKDRIVWWEWPPRV